MTMVPGVDVAQRGVGGEVIASNTTAERVRAKAPLPRLLWDFTLIGATAFGMGKLAYLQDTFVRRHRWMTNEEFTEGLALSAILPGPNITNLAAYTGWLLGGWPGGLLAWLGMLLPGFVVTLLVAVAAHSGAFPPVVTGALAGVGAASVCLMLTTIVRTAPPACRSVRGGWLVAAGVFVAVGPLRMGVLPALGVFGVLSLILNRPKRRQREPVVAEAAR